MRNKKNLCAIVCCILTIFLSINVIYATEMIDEKKVEKIGYEYPIKPGMEYWGKLNHAERVNMLQIPSKVLKKNGTEELVDVVLEYPCFIDMVYYSTYQIGFEAVSANFNGLQELLSREDAGFYLLQKYIEKDLLAIMMNANLEETFDELLQILFMETLLAQPVIADDLSDNELTILSDKTEENKNIHERFLSKSITGATTAYYKILAEIQGIQTLASQEMYVYTPKGTPVLVTYDGGSWDYGATMNSIWRKKHKEQFPSINIIGDATSKYNCHAYAWADSTMVWMTDPSAYWEDTSYNWSANSISSIGQKVYYVSSDGSMDHSGVVISLTGNQIRSKWGQSILVEHAIGDCPYYVSEKFLYINVYSFDGPS